MDFRFTTGRSEAPAFAVAARAVAVILFEDLDDLLLLWLIRSPSDALSRPSPATRTDEALLSLSPSELVLLTLGSDVSIPLDLD